MCALLGTFNAIKRRSRAFFQALEVGGLAGHFAAEMVVLKADTPTESGAAVAQSRGAICVAAP